MSKRSKGSRAIEGTAKPFSVKIFQDDYDDTDQAARATGIPKSILFRLVYREALRDGYLKRVSGKGR